MILDVIVLNTLSYNHLGHLFITHLWDSNFLGGLFCLFVSPVELLDITDSLKKAV